MIRLGITTARQVVKSKGKLAAANGSSAPTLGRFEPQDAQRIIDRLDEEHIPYEMDTPGEVRPAPTFYLHRHWVYIYVRPEHKAKAEAIVLEDFRI